MRPSDAPVQRREQAAARRPAASDQGLVIVKGGTQTALPGPEKSPGDHVAEGMEAANGESERAFDVNYRTSGVPAAYRHGYAPGGETLWKGGGIGSAGGRFLWQLAPFASASRAIRTWLAGPTVAECGSTLVAVQLLALVETLGDARFDLMFGSTTKLALKPYEYLICPFPDKTPLKHVLSEIELMTAKDKGAIGARPGLKRGDTVYFVNHPAYIMKHPGGLWSGENAVYDGEIDGAQTFSGFGASKKTEEAMNESLVEAYNAEGRTGNWPDTIDVPTLLASGGGLVTNRAQTHRQAQGWRLDEKKVNDLAGRK